MLCSCSRFAVLSAASAKRLVKSFSTPNFFLKFIFWSSFKACFSACRVSRTWIAFISFYSARGRIDSKYRVFALWDTRSSTAATISKKKKMISGMSGPPSSSEFDSRESGRGRIGSATAPAWRYLPLVKLVFASPIGLLELSDYNPMSIYSYWSSTPWPKPWVCPISATYLSTPNAKTPTLPIWFFIASTIKIQHL